MKSPPLDSTHGRQRRAWHDITAIGQHIWWNDVGRGMPSSHLDSTHGRTTSSVACHRRLSVARMVKRHRECHDITVFGQHTQSDYIGCGMTSLPLDNTLNRTTSGVASHHRPWTARTIGRRQAWHEITALGQHTRSATSGVASHHRPWTKNMVKQRRPWHAIVTFWQHT